MILTEKNRHPVWRAAGAGLLCVLFCAAPGLAREHGWVPLEQNQQELIHRITNDKPAVPNRTKSAKNSEIKKISVLPRAANLSVYDEQPPVTEKEVNLFLELLPRFRQWTRTNGEDAHPIVNEKGKPDFLYSPRSAQWLAAHDFDPARFFCVMGKMAASLAIIEEGNDYKGTHPKDMPGVQPQELELARRHLGELLNAGGPPQPIGRN